MSGRGHPFGGTGPGAVAATARALLVVGTVGGCAAVQPALPDRQQSCGRQADAEFGKQNRYLMSMQDQTGTPYSANALPGDPTRGLGDQYRRDRMVEDCLHSADDAGPTGPATGPAAR